MAMVRRPVRCSFAENPVLRHRPAKSQVGTFEIYEGTWGDTQTLFCLIYYSSLLTNQKFHVEMLPGPLENRQEREVEAQAIVDPTGAQPCEQPR
jgi:hypothetical protein